MRRYVPYRFRFSAYWYITDTADGDDQEPIKTLVGEYAGTEEAEPIQFVCEDDAKTIAGILNQQHDEITRLNARRVEIRFPLDAHTWSEWFTASDTVDVVQFDTIQTRISE